MRQTNNDNGLYQMINGNQLLTLQQIQTFLDWR